jgi:hypothetical protein
MKQKHSLCCWLLFTLSAAAPAPGLTIQEQPDDGQWTMPGEKLRVHPLQYFDRHQYRDCQKSEVGLDILNGPDAWT